MMFEELKIFPGKNERIIERLWGFSLPLGAIVTQRSPVEIIPEKFIVKIELETPTRISCTNNAVLVKIQENILPGL